MFPAGKLHALIGPTASGKSDLALALAERSGAEIVSLDSMQVYRGMDIGTAKPDRGMLERVPHHMLDLVEPDVRYDIQRFLADLTPVLKDIHERGQRALLVGGTAFYLKVLTHGLFEGPDVDPVLRARLEQEARELGNEAFHERLARVDPDMAQRLHPNDTRRVVRGLEVFEQSGRPLSDWQSQWNLKSGERAAGCERHLVGVGHAVPDLDARIRRRTAEMIEQGWPAEAERVRSSTGFGPTAIQALGYAQVLQLVDGERSRTECVEEIALKTRQFARKQRTWYRKFDEIVWLEGSARDDLDAMVTRALVALDWA